MFVQKITNFLNKRKWILPVLFAEIVLCFVGTIVFVELRQFNNLSPTFAFSIGGEICALAVAMMMALSTLPSWKRQNGYIRLFVTLLAIGSLSMFLDSAQMLVDGRTEFVMANKIAAILVFASEILYIYFFWLFMLYVLKIENKAILIVTFVLTGIFVVFLFLPITNLFYPLYFRINEATGEYSRVTTFWIHRIFLVLVAICLVAALIISKEKLKTKLIIVAFMAIPLVSIGVGGFRYGVSILYSSMMVSLMLIYAFLFSDNEKHLYSTSKELGLATEIQMHMLPSIFPAFPERKEFDIYASMTPAKEVGGDFYDFFLIDKDHLGLVIADVSDKGVPAALFMMASKIMVQNFMMLGQSPKVALESVNKQICHNKQDEMFVTIWVAVLDLKTGVMTCANAGHEKPVIKQKDGLFEIVKDKHGFVVGWFPESKYEEYEIKLEKGAKLFVHTDGVPEATLNNERFGRERMIESLNNYKDLPVEEIVKNMKKDIDEFAKNQQQFDDITMLCLEYRGYENE